MAKSKILTPAEELQLNAVKTHIETQINAAAPKDVLQVACDNFKYSFEEAIKIAADKGKQSLTTSSCHINLFHEVVKSEMIRNGIAADLIFPQKNYSSGELKLTGFIKAKRQDVTAVPRAYLHNKTPELVYSGMMTGDVDEYGKDYTENCLVINVRSQMSSIGKNNDTIFERAFAETLNLHMRCPKMVLGEFFILPITGFKMDKVKKNKPEYEPIISVKAKKNSTTTAEAIEKTINTYTALNKRDSKKDEAFKYERLCLILADFSKSPVKIYKNENELKADNLLPSTSKVSMKEINFDNFISDLLTIYSTRFGTNKFK